MNNVVEYTIHVVTMPALTLISLHHFIQLGFVTMNVTIHRIDKKNDQPPVVVSSQPLMADPLRSINNPM
jgi:hypothetical protein